MKLELTDSRRLTGANLFGDSPGAVIDVVIEGDASEVICAWKDTVKNLLEAVGYSDEQTCYRTWEGGASLLISAPIDVLYSMCELNEAAWAAVAHELGAGDGPNLVEALPRLNRLFDEESNPPLLALQRAARDHGVPFLWDDDEISIGYGKTTQVWPPDQLPHPDDIDWDAPGSIPVALVTGTNGKSTTVRMTASILSAAGFCTGLTSTDFIRAGERMIDRGDYSGTGGTRTLMRQGDVEMAVLEVARGGLLRRGLGVEHADVAVVTNVAADHLGDYGIHSVADLIPAKFIVRRALGAGDPLVLNADDAGVTAFAADLDNQLAWFSLDAENARIRQALLAGETACYLEDGWLVIAQGEKLRRLVHVGQVPATRVGLVRYNVGNAMAAVLVALTLGISDDAIREGLALFRGDESDNPGRGNWFEREITTDSGKGMVQIVVDFAHNEHGMLALADAVRQMSCERVVLLMGQAGDRSDRDIRDMLRAACGMGPERLLVAALPGYERGRELFEVPAIIRREAILAGVPEHAIETCDSPRDATAQALADVRPGDLIVLLALTQRDEALELVHRFIGSTDG